LYFPRYGPDRHPLRQKLMDGLNGATIATRAASKWGEVPDKYKKTLPCITGVVVGLVELFELLPGKVWYTSRIPTRYNPVSMMGQ